MTSTFQFQTEFPEAAHGIPAARLCFSGGRTAVELVPHGGLSSIRHFGTQRYPDAELFRGDVISAWAHLFRPFADFGEHRQYVLELNHTTFYPFGYDSCCEFENVGFRHRMTVLNNAIVWELEQTAAAPCPFHLMLADSAVATRVQRPGRHWEDFARVSPDVCRGAVQENYPPQHKAEHSLTQQVHFRGDRHPRTVLAVAAAKQLEFNLTRGYFKKEYFRAEARDGYAALVLAFGNDEAATLRDAARIARDARAIADAERASARAAVRAGTRLECGNAVLENFCRMFPEVSHSLEVRDLPGAVRAADSGYWVWGWDGMVHSDALMLAGRHEAILARLHYYRDHADARKGVFHACDTDGNFLIGMAPAAQTIYAVMLYNYTIYSRNRTEAGACYPFARKLLWRALRDQDERTGLCRGVGFYPDFPEDFGQDGNDIAAINNGILFQAFRGMEEVAGFLGKTADADRFRRAGDRIGDGIRQWLYDAETGYFYDSLSAATLEPRRCYPIYAILALTPFVRELTAGREDEIARFMERNFTQKIGASMLARTDKRFYADGNQQGMYMPVAEGFYRYRMQHLRRPDSLLAVIEREWSQCRLMEALSAEAVNMGATADNPGRKQLFTGACWYSLAFHLFCGLEFHADELVIHTPSLARDKWHIRNLAWGDRQLNIRYEGGSGELAQIQLDGKPVSGNRIAFDQLAARKSKLTIRRKP